MVELISNNHTQATTVFDKLVVKGRRLRRMWMSFQSYYVLEIRTILTSLHSLSQKMNFWRQCVIVMDRKQTTLFSERELKFMFAICHRPSVCRLSVTLVHPAQAIEIFGNISTPFGTLAIRNLCIKILRRSSQRNPSVGGVKHKRGSRI